MPRKAKNETVDKEEATPAAADFYVNLTANLVCSYVSRNQVPMGELAGLIATFHAALTGTATGQATESDRTLLTLGLYANGRRLGTTAHS